MEEKKEVNVSEILKGLGLYTLAYTSFTFYCMLVKVTMVRFELSVPELCYSYSLLVMPVMYLSSRVFKADLLDIPKNIQGSMVKRCITGCACDLLMFYAYQYTSYSKAFCLFFTNTLYCPFLAAYILQEHVKKWDVIGIIFGFTGMLLLVQPWKDTTGNITLVNDLIGSSFGLASGFLAAVAMVYTRQLATNLHFTVQPFYF